MGGRFSVRVESVAKTGYVASLLGGITLTIQPKKMGPGENEQESRSESRGGGFLSSSTRSCNGNRVGIVHSIPCLTRYPLLGQEKKNNSLGQLSRHVRHSLISSSSAPSSFIQHSRLIDESRHVSVSKGQLPHYVDPLDFKILFPYLTHTHTKVFILFLNILQERKKKIHLELLEQSNRRFTNCGTDNTERLYRWKTAQQLSELAGFLPRCVSSCPKENC